MVTETINGIQIKYPEKATKKYIDFVRSQASRFTSTKLTEKLSEKHASKTVIALDHEFNVIDTGDTFKDYDRIVNRANQYRRCGEKALSGVIIDDKTLSVFRCATKPPSVYSYTTEPTEQNTTKVVVEVGEYGDNKLLYISKEYPGNRHLVPSMVIVRDFPEEGYRIETLFADNWLY